MGGGGVSVGLGVAVGTGVDIGVDVGGGGGVYVGTGVNVGSSVGVRVEATDCIISLVTFVNTSRFKALPSDGKFRPGS